VAKHIEGQVPPLSQVARDAPPALCRVIHGLLRKNPAERYPSAEELLKALERVEARLAVSQAAATGTMPAARRAPVGGASLPRVPLAERREAKKQQRRRIALIAGGSAAAIALLLALLLVVGRKGERPEPKTVAKARPTTSTGPARAAAERRERSAETLLKYARRAAGKGAWLSVQNYLDRLKSDYANTKFYATNRAAIAALRAKTHAALRKKPTPPKPTPRPKPPVKPEPPPDDDERWTEWVDLFDGKTLNGWRVVEEGQFAKHGKVRVDNEGLVLEQGRWLTGVAWTGHVPRQDYEISLDAKHTGGQPRLCRIVFPAGTWGSVFAVGDGTGAAAALYLVNGKNHFATERMTFERGRWYRVRLRVTKARVEGWIEQQKVIDLPTAGNQFRVRGDYKPLVPLGLATNATTAVLRDIRLRRLKREILLPRPDAEGWIPLFDGNSLKGWTSNTGRYDKIRVEDGWIVLDKSPGLFHATRGRDMVVRATVTKPTQGNAGLSLRSDARNGYVGWSTAGGYCGIGKLVDGKYSDLVQRSSWIKLGETFELTFSAIGDTLTLYLNGKQVLQTRDPTHRAGAPGIRVYRTAARFRDIAVYILDKDRAPPAPPTRPAEKTEPRAERERRRQLEARYAQALKPIEAMIEAWDFQGAAESLAKLDLGTEGATAGLPSRALAARLARRRDEVERLARLKAKMIAKINRAKPRLQTTKIRTSNISCSALARASRIR